MARTANLSPLGLYQWDNHIFDLFQIPQELNKDTLIDNLLAETAELEVLYPNPVVFKNLVGVWSAKNLDVWNRLYATTQYEYNPIENYNRYETGSEDGSGSTVHSGTDTNGNTTAFQGSDTKTNAVILSGRDVNTERIRESGDQTTDTSGANLESGDQTTDKTGANLESGDQKDEMTNATLQGGSDVVTGEDTKGHWIAGFDSVPSGNDDGLVKQTRDQDNSEVTTTYGKREDGEGEKTTTFGKRVDTEDHDTTTFGKRVDTESHDTITFGKHEDNTNEMDYGKREDGTETMAYGHTIGANGSTTYGHTITNNNEGSHELHAHGNIGVTTTQKLIREQRQVDLFNLYDIIIEDFKMRFCILIY